MDTGERIKQARKRLDLTQEAFGKLAGVSKAAVSQWESGRTKPERDALLSLKRKRGISLEWITSGKGEMFDTITGGETVELSPAWDLLTQEQRQNFTRQIQEQAESNQAIYAQLAPPGVTKRTVNVAERRLAQANRLPFADRRKKGEGNA